MTRVNDVVNLWAKLQVIKFFESCQRTNSNPFYDYRLHGRSNTDWRPGTIIPTVDDIVIVKVDNDEGSPPAQIGDCTWDSGEPATIVIYYRMATEPHPENSRSAHSCHASIELEELMAGILEAADRIPKETQP